MDFQLRCISSHPRAVSGSTSTEFVFSSRSPRLVTAAGDLLIDQSTSTNAIRSSIRTSARIEKLVYVGGSTTFLVFMENGLVASYFERVNCLSLVHEKRIGGAGRSVTLSEGSQFGRFAIFCKADSPSLWCLSVTENGALADPFKLRSDIEGDQENVKFVGGVFAKVRGKVATKPKSRACPIASIATHPSMSLVSAAYTNGIIRVWDISKKEQRSHFDSQLLMGERIVDMAMHPTLPVVVACTTQGRIMSFYAKNVPFKYGDLPLPASSKTRERKRRFRAMCFMPGSPAYLLLLTATRRILVRMIDKASLIMNSSRFPKASRPLSVDSTSLLTSARSGGLDDRVDSHQEGSRYAKLSCEPAFGLIATCLERGGDIFVFQTRVCGLPGIRRPISSGLDTGFSKEHSSGLQGPVLVPSDSIIAYKGVLFSYSLGSEQATALCQLPPGDTTRIEVARDLYGYCQAALIFYLGDDEVNQTLGYTENEDPAKYVLCTRRGEGETWNVSEPGEGQSGCFLNLPGRHDRIMILASSGTMLSLLSFAGTPDRNGVPSTRQGRGVQRVKLHGKKAVAVFRTPFAVWSAVLYHDPVGKKLCVSKNAFDPLPAAGVQSSPIRIDEDFAMDEDTGLALQEKEVVIDIRWQHFPSKHGKEEYFGAVMTNRRILFVRNLLELVAVFDFQSVDRIVVPFSPPSISWIGPSVAVLFGNSLISVTLDGRSDLIAGVSHGENVTALVATLPDRIVFARPSPKHAMNSLSMASRPYSPMSGVLRSIFTLQTSTGRSGSRHVEKVRAVLESHDVSQGSIKLTKALLINNLAPIAYLLAVSEQGKYSMSPLRRAAFLGRIGDIRGALSIAETEYSLMESLQSFHQGTDLFRLLQRILNMSLACRDFDNARRCSQLLGRKGTFSAFVEAEGGYAAITSLVDHAKEIGNDEMAKALRPLITRSSKSSVATDSSLVPSQRDLQTIRRAIQSVDLSSIPLGRADVSSTFISVAPVEDSNGNIKQGATIELERAKTADMSDRLEMWRRDVAFEFSGEEIGRYEELGMNARDTDTGYQESENVETIAASSQGLQQTADSSDDEDLFNTGGENESIRRGGEGTAGSEDVIERESAMLRHKIQQQREQTAVIVEHGQQATRALLTSQRDAATTGEHIPAMRANDMFDRGLRKLEEGYVSLAQKHFESGLRVIQRGSMKGQEWPVELIHELVYYKLMAHVKGAIEEIGTSAHANTIAGRMTYLQLAMGLAGLPLREKHRLQALLEATDANMLANNFGSAAQMMHGIKKLGLELPDEVRVSLRDKYAVCSARGFTDTRAQGIVQLCFHTLRVLGGGRYLFCNVCPARFVTDGGVEVDGTCVSCGIGKVGIP